MSTNTITQLRTVKANTATKVANELSRTGGLLRLAPAWVPRSFLQPGLRIKLNTVVNQLNHDEDLSVLIQCMAPDKWKVLRMLPVVNHHLAVSDEQFAAFVARHRAFEQILCAEDNQDMHESYLMIDPHGRFFQNSPLIAGQGYVYSQPILEVGAATAFSQMSFDSDRFSARYAQVKDGVRV